MAEITAAINEHRKAGISRQRKQQPKTDMTPMVDLGFLLISFFVITTELTKPVTMNLYMPKDGPLTPLPQSDALTVLLGKRNSIYYYQGNWEDAVKSNQIIQTNFAVKNEIRRVIQEKQKQLDSSNKKEGRAGLMLLIKPGEEATYQNIIDMLDEAMIHDIKNTRCSNRPKPKPLT